MRLDHLKKEKTLDRKIKGQKNTYSDCVRPSCRADASVIFLSLYFLSSFPLRLRYVRAGQSVVFRILVAAEGLAGLTLHRCDKNQKMLSSLHQAHRGRQLGSPLEYSALPPPLLWERGRG